MTLEALVAEDAPQVRVPFEAEAEHVAGLALEPVGGLPDRDQRRQDGIVLVSGTFRRSRAPRCIE